MSTLEIERQISQLKIEFSARVTNLEEQVNRLALQTETPDAPPETAWWKKIVGVYKDDPEFEEATRSGREYRESLRSTDEEATV